jgi:hypothetical protein
MLLVRVRGVDAGSIPVTGEMAIGVPWAKVKCKKLAWKKLPQPVGLGTAIERQNGHIDPTLPVTGNTMR